MPLEHVLLSGIDIQMFSTISCGIPSLSTLALLNRSRMGRTLLRLHANTMLGAGHQEFHE
jgi:hypothetical protein